MKELFFKTICIIFFLFFYVDLNAQISKYSEFYDSTGRLLADTSFKINDIKNMPYLVGRDKQLIYNCITGMDFPGDDIDNGVAGLFIIEIGIIPVSNDKYLAKVAYIKLAKDEYKKWVSPKIFSDTSRLKREQFEFPEPYKSSVPFKIYIPIKFIEAEGKDFKIEKYYDKGVINFKATSIPLDLH